ncbi:unnamed protein product [Rhizoctonia solani]|uniref:Uncharacterized protein n=1 Tax=Rhizoctonia solani TaxID=456999 RepID=A0A8H3E3A2_9AGAM|nr:unnamed protein product [Rhizoctonia solani]
MTGGMQVHPGELKNTKEAATDIAAELGSLLTVEEVVVGEAVVVEETEVEEEEEVEVEVVEVEADVDQNKDI